MTMEATYTIPTVYVDDSCIRIETAEAQVGYWLFAATSTLGVEAFCIE